MVSKKKPEKPAAPKNRRGSHRGAASAPSKKTLPPDGRWVMVLDERFHRRMVFEKRDPS